MVHQETPQIHNHSNMIFIFSLFGLLIYKFLMKQKKQVPRKQQRKAKREQKKQRIQKYHSKKQSSIPNTKNEKRKKKKRKIPSKQKASTNEVQHENYIRFEEQAQQQQIQSENSEAQVKLDDQDIEKYEQKLSIKKNKGKQYKNIAKSLGFDDDLFDFLDNISKTVKQEKNHKKTKKKQALPNYIEEVQEQDEVSGEPQISEEEEEEEQEHEDEIIESVSQKKPEKHAQDKQQIAEIQRQLQKKMNSLFNKISDGNLMYTFKQFMKIIEEYPRAYTVKIFCFLFVKFNLMIEKPLLHVLTANVVIAVALHKAYGQRIMAHLVHGLTQKYLQLMEQAQDAEEVLEIGYSKLFQCKKNYIVLICYLYEFQSISGDFIFSLVEQLTKNMNKDSIQFLYIIIQKCGPQLRNRDTSILKQTIDLLKKSMEQYKQQLVEQDDETMHVKGKIKFIEIQLNEIRFNRKNVFDKDQRMGFLHTFLSKNVPKEIEIDDHILINSFEDIVHGRINQPNWWEISEGKQEDDQDNGEAQQVRIQTKEIKQLKQLANAYRFVTQTRKNIFLAIMSAKDYIEATSNILSLKVRKMEDVATVIVEINQKQPMFNPFYVLTAAKLCSEIPKLRVSLQFAIWDRLKQLQQMDVRKISNLGKFLAWLISSEVSNCSLTMLKYYPDLINQNSHASGFITAFFKEFFLRAKKKSLIKVAHKLREKKNSGFQPIIKEYLTFFKNSYATEQNIKKIKLLLRLLHLQAEQEMEQENYR